MIKEREKIRTDDEGYLLEPAEWSEEIAADARFVVKHLAEAQGLGAG